MKKILPTILVLLLTVCCTGCNNQVTKYSTPATFYYCVEKPSYATDSSIIRSEERTINCPPNDYKAIMQVYLEGPKERKIYSPFPKDLTITELMIDGETTYITFSTNLSYLTGINLTLACVCIANTCFDLTHSQNVDISAEHALLDNAPSVFISRGSTLTSDIH